MSLVDALKTPPEGTKGRKLDVILAKVSSAEREVLVLALSDVQKWPSDALARVISAHVSPIAEASVRRYRRDVLGIVQ